MAPSTSVHESIYTDLYTPAVIVAASFTVVALILSTYLILQHLRSYNNPSEQLWVVCVLFMVPVYATESIISLWNPNLSLACDILRNCYEAFALYSFGSYLVACLGGERRVIELLEEKSGKLLNKAFLEGEDEYRRKPHWSLRNFFSQPTILGKYLLNIEKFGLVQYMILKTVCAFLALVLEICGVYGNGEFKWYYGYPYIAVVLNFSQMWALYCLVQFYNVTHEWLQPIRPLAKFISFKAIVFATWWQGVGIALLCAFGILPNQERIQTGLQDFLICIEMAVAAVAHVYVFSAEPYQYIPSSSGYEKITTTETTKEEVAKLEDGESTPAVVEEKETQVEAPGTSVRESVQDIVLEGGHHVVKDVVLTINQAIGPVEKGVTKGVTKIQETFHQRSEEQDDKSDICIEEHVEFPEELQEMKIFNWMQSKLTGIPQTKKPNLELFDNQPISEWPHGLLTIGTLGNNDFKEDHQHASPPPSPRDPLHDITAEEATRLQNELNSFLNEQEVDPSNSSAAELAGKFLNRQTSLKLAEKNSNNAAESDAPKDDLNSRFQRSTNMVYSRGKDVNCLDNTNTAIGKKSLPSLLKKMFVCRSGFSPPIAAPGLKDPIPESRMEKILRAILHKKIYPQQSSNSTLSMNKYLENKNKTKSFTANEEKLNNKGDDSDSDDDGSKWDKTDSEYIVLEIQTKESLDHIYMHPTCFTTGLDVIQHNV